MHIFYKRQIIWLKNNWHVNGSVQQEQPTCASLPCCEADDWGLGSRWGPLSGPSGGKTFLLDMRRPSFWGPSSRNSSLSLTSCSVKTSVSSSHTGLPNPRKLSVNYLKKWRRVAIKSHWKFPFSCLFSPSKLAKSPHMQPICTRTPDH